MLNSMNQGAMPDLSGQFAQEKPLGSFTRMQNAVSALREATAEVQILASDLVGQEPQGSKEATDCESAGGALRLLDDEADEVAQIAKDIIKHVRRIREKAC